MSEIEIKIDGKMLYVWIGKYIAPNNTALAIRDEYGFSEARVSTNPEIELPENTIAIRDDEKFLGKYINALTGAGIITKTRQQIGFGWVTATLYKVEIPNEQDLE